jgi:hypothetical protein
MGVGTILIHQSGYTAEEYSRISSQLAKAADRLHLLVRVGDCDIYRLLPATDVPRPVVTAVVAPSAIADGHLHGQLLLSNPAPTYRVLYPTGRPQFVAEITDAAGKRVLRTTIAVSFLALLDPGQVPVPFDIAAPLQPGQYTVAVHADGLPTFRESPPTSLHVLDAASVPHLVFDGQRLTSPSLFLANEPVSLWITLSNQTTMPLPDATATSAGSIAVAIRRIPAGSARIVAHGQISGLELWVDLK